MWNEFRRFISRGNVIDMAVGIIIGASFSKMIDSLVNNIIMPPIGFLLGGIDFSGFKITIKKATDTASAVTIDYGLFINTIINFFIIALAIFLLIKVVSSIYRKDEPEETDKKCGYCTTILNTSKN